MSQAPTAILRTAQRNTSEVTNFGRQSLVFMASQHAVYQCLFHASQRHFVAFDAIFVDRLSAWDEPDATVRLVLLAQSNGAITPSQISECRRRFPAAAIGLMVEHGSRDVDPMLIEHRLIQGVLPLTLPLDVWLAVVSLLLAGGEYLAHDSSDVTNVSGMVSDYSIAREAGNPGGVPYPQYAQNGRETEVGAAEAALSFAKRGHGTTHAGSPGFASLTMRERQILQLVAEGYQNKLIADRMDLSEHTVKAHVHNLIAKLRVTNRTQAAAFFHEHELAMAPRAEERGDARLATSPGR